MIPVAPILPLPPDVAAQIKSSTTITAIKDVVLGLLRNSIDACSTQIIVTVDPARGSCVVRDDGTGIAAAEFEVDGGLGQPFCKYTPLRNVTYF